MLHLNVLFRQIPRSQRDSLGPVNNDNTIRLQKGIPHSQTCYKKLLFVDQAFFTDESIHIEVISVTSPLNGSINSSVDKVNIYPLVYLNLTRKRHCQFVHTQKALGKFLCAFLMAADYMGALVHRNSSCLV